jgi:hypothetical protein
VRYALVAAGVTAFGLAVLPGGAALVPVEAALALLGNDYFLVGALGVVALLVLVGMVARRATSRVDQAEPPDPETVPDAPRPGSEFDALLEGRPALHPRRRAETVERVRERLREAAVVAQMRREGCTRAVAEDRVDAGEWTDDPVAAAFLRPDGPPRPSAIDRLRLALRGGAWYQHCARTTARAVARATDGGVGR